MYLKMIVLLSAVMFSGILCAVPADDDVKSQVEYGKVLFWGRGGIEKDEQEAFRWILKAAEKGNSEAQFALCMMYGSGRGIDNSKATKEQKNGKNHAEAVKYLYKAAAQNLSPEHFVFGWDIYRDHSRSGKNCSGIINVFREAADKGLALAQYFLGRSYADGVGVKHDDLEAIKWLQKSAERGYPPAYWKLGDLYRSMALQCYHKAAEKGDAETQFNLGMCYRYGNIIGETDYAESLKWLRKAAERGDGAAQMVLY